MSGGPIVFRAVPVSPAELVAYWPSQYKHDLDTAYTNNIGKPRTRDVILELFRWKNGGAISAGMSRPHSCPNSDV